jgi:hypothetical protein
VKRGRGQLLTLTQLLRRRRKLDLSTWFPCFLTVDAVQSEAELEVLRRSVRRGAPFGSSSWLSSTAEELGMQATLRVPGRP